MLESENGSSQRKKSPCIFYFNNSPTWVYSYPSNHGDVHPDKSRIHPGNVHESELRGFLQGREDMTVEENDREKLQWAAQVWMRCCSLLSRHKYSKTIDMDGSDKFWRNLTKQMKFEKNWRRHLKYDIKHVKEIEKYEWNTYSHAWTNWTLYIRRMLCPQEGRAEDLPQLQVDMVEYWIFGLFA